MRFVLVLQFPFVTKCQIKSWCKHISRKCRGGQCVTRQSERLRGRGTPPSPLSWNLRLSSRAENSRDWSTCRKRRLRSLPIMGVHPTHKDDVPRLCNSSTLFIVLSFWVEWNIAIQAQGDSYFCTLQQQGCLTSGLSVSCRISTAWHTVVTRH